MFRFTQPRPEAGGHSPPFPPLSPVADCPVRVRTERRVSRTPYKVRPVLSHVREQRCRLRPHACGAMRVCRRAQILDAPKLPDDFYMNLVDWSASNMLAVGLGSTVFLWNAQNSSVRPRRGPRGRASALRSHQPGSWSSVAAALRCMLRACLPRLLPPGHAPQGHQACSPATRGRRAA